MEEIEEANEKALEAVVKEVVNGGVVASYKVSVYLFCITGFGSFC